MGVIAVGQPGNAVPAARRSEIGAYECWLNQGDVLDLILQSVGCGRRIVPEYWQRLAEQEAAAANCGNLITSCATRQLVLGYGLTIGLRLHEFVGGYLAPSIARDRMRQELRAQFDALHSVSTTSALVAHYPFDANANDAVGTLLDDRTDCDEVAEVVTESYRVLAPKKLNALLDGAPPPATRP